MTRRTKIKVALGLSASLMILATPVRGARGERGAFPFFDDGFENASTFVDLFPADASRWTGFQNEPAGNIVDLTQEQVRSGSQALKCFAQPYDGSTASKADISRSLLTFGIGDEVWTETYFYIVGGANTLSLFLWDLEATATCTAPGACPEQGAGTICSSPGRRLFLSGPDGDWLKSDLGKWCVGEDFTQGPGPAIPFPKDQWVRLRVYMVLSPNQDGVMKVWQDGDLVIDAVGITLPRADSLYDRLQVGITANGNKADAHTVYIDDVKIWDAAPPWWTDPGGPAGDLDGDGDVDLSDFVTFAGCFSGAGVTTPPGGCDPNDFANADLDLDNDVDLSDFITFAGNFTG